MRRRGMSLAKMVATVLMGGGVSATYISKVLGYSPLAYWPLNETSGTAIIDAAGAMPNGTYANVTLNNATGPDGVNGSPLFNGTTSLANIFSATLAAAFTGGPAGSISAWCKVAAAGVWTDGAFRYAINLPVDDNNYIHFRKSSVDGRLQSVYKAGGTVKDANATGISPTDWFHVAITWDKNAGASGELKGYLNGTQFGTTTTGLGTWSGSIASAAIGSQTANNLVWSGWLAHVAIWNTAKDLATVQELADPNP